MSASLRENWLEALVGVAVLAVAAWFLSFAYRVTGSGARGGTYELTARFPNATGVTAGTDIRISGLKVGQVTRLDLDPKTYQAVARFTVDGAVKLPADSSAAITQAGLLGGSYVSLVPGGDAAVLRPGDEISDTQGSADLMGLIGQYVNRSGPGAGAQGAAPSAPEGGAK